MLLCIEIVKGYGANHTLLWRTRETSSVKRSYLCGFVSQKLKAFCFPYIIHDFQGKSTGKWMTGDVFCAILCYDKLYK